jgi:hypothetical protein
VGDVLLVLGLRVSPRRTTCFAQAVVDLTRGRGRHESAARFVISAEPDQPVALDWPGLCCRVLVVVAIAYFAVPTYRSSVTILGPIGLVMAETVAVLVAVRC